MSDKHSDSRRYYDWLDKASDDVESARLLMKSENCYQNAAFHCQQTVEKSLKAYILLRTGNLRDGHNLPWLCKQAIRHDKGFSQWLDESANLNKCYIETRYPADIPITIDGNRINIYFTMARDMHNYICIEVDIALEEGRSHPSQTKNVKES